MYIVDMYSAAALHLKLVASLGRGVEVEAVAGGLVEEAGQAALHRGGGGRGGGQQPVHLVTVRYVEPG